MPRPDGQAFCRCRRYWLVRDRWSHNQDIRRPREGMEQTPTGPSRRQHTDQPGQRAGNWVVFLDLLHGHEDCLRGSARVVIPWLAYQILAHWQRADTIQHGGVAQFLAMDDSRCLPECERQIAQLSRKLVGAGFIVKGLFEVNRDGVLVRLPGVVSCWLRCVICVGGRGCRRCGRACAGSPGSGTRMPGGPRVWRAGSGFRRRRS